MFLKFFLGFSALLSPFSYRGSRLLVARWHSKAPNQVVSTGRPARLLAKSCLLARHCLFRSLTHSLESLIFAVPVFGCSEPLCFVYDVARGQGSLAMTSCVSRAPRGLPTLQEGVSVDLISPFRITFLRYFRSTGLSRYIYTYFYLFQLVRAPHSVVPRRPNWFSLSFATIFRSFSISPTSSS